MSQRAPSFVGYVFSGLPGWFCRVLGVVVGGVLWHVVRLRRRVAESNIRMALQVTRREARRLGARTYRHLGLLVIEFMRVRRLSGAYAERLLGQDNVQRLRQIADGGPGAIVVSAHLGDWDLLACCAALCGFDVNVITRKIKNRRINAFWMGERDRCGVTLLEVGPGCARRAVRALQRGGIVAVVLDQHDPHGLVVPFFGRPAATSATAARLALATGAPVVTAFLVRRGGEHALALSSPLETIRTGQRRQDIFINTRRYTEAIEQAIRSDPEQWFWVHRRWKVQPRV